MNKPLNNTSKDFRAERKHGGKKKPTPSLRRAPAPEQAGFDSKRKPAGVRGKARKRRKKRNASRFPIISGVTSLLFYLAVAAVLFMSMTYFNAGNRSRPFFGYTFFTIVSRSMQREIPKGSLIAVKAVDPETLKEGDDITFIRSDNNKITHRIVGIIEYYDETGGRGFVTKGLENPEADREVAHEANVIGIVAGSVPELGFALSYMSSNLPVSIAIFAAVIAASKGLGMYFDEKRREKAARRRRKNRGTGVIIQGEKRVRGVI
jgi:signal peptidase